MMSIPCGRLDRLQPAVAERDDLPGVPNRNLESIKTTQLFVPDQHWNYAVIVN